MNEEYTININGHLFPVFKNPTDEQYQILFDLFTKEYPFCPSGEPKTRQTFDRKDNKYVWMSGNAMHYLVESFLLKNHGIECNQNKHFDDAVA